MMTNKNKNPVNILKSNSGFIIADFLFSFVLVIGIGIVIFGLTFSLATIEIAQYIVWSSARNFAAANITKETAAQNALLKFNNLSEQFPSLTGRGNSPWFKLDDFRVGDLAKIDQDFIQKIPAGSDIGNMDLANERRQPWIGASAKITLKLFAGLQIPFLGKVAEDPDKFAFPVRAFIIRSPSVAECKSFFTYEKRFESGIKKIDAFSKMNDGLVAAPSATQERKAYLPQEDNGC